MEAIIEYKIMQSVDIPKTLESFKKTISMTTKNIKVKRKKYKKKNIPVVIAGQTLPFIGQPWRLDS